MVPGAMFSTVTSAFLSSSRTISSPRGDFTFKVTDFLLALNWWKYHGSSGWPGCSRRPGSPVRGFSIFTTSAPSQARVSVHEGPASTWVKSTTRMPLRQSSSTPMLIADPPVATACRPCGEASILHHGDRADRARGAAFDLKRKADEFEPAFADDPIEVHKPLD